MAFSRACALVAAAALSIVLPGCGDEAGQGSADLTDLGVCGGKKVLVVMSSSSVLTVRGDDGALHAYPTGVFLREWTDPVMELIGEGCDVEYATPGGAMVTIDSNSLEPLWQYFPYIEEKPRALERRDEAMALAIAHLGEVRFSQEVDRWTRLTPEVDAYVDGVRSEVAGKQGSYGILSLEQALANLRSDAAPYAAVLVPGGHVPMEDLVVDSTLGDLLREAHARSMPTALVCHAPVALLAARTGEEWIYDGYEVTVADRMSEQLLENAGPLQGYHVTSYVDDELERAGAKLRQNPFPGYPQVVLDRELLTGQNPASAPFLGVTLVESIRAYLDNPEGAWWNEVRAYRLDEQVMERQSEATRRFKKTMSLLVEDWGPFSSPMDVLADAAELFGRRTGPVNVFTSREYLALYDTSLTVRATISHDGPAIVGKQGEATRLDEWGLWPFRYYVYKPYFHAGAGP